MDKLNLQHKVKACDKDLGVKWKYGKKGNQWDGLRSVCLVHSHMRGCVCLFIHYILRLLC